MYESIELNKCYCFREQPKLYVGGLVSLVLRKKRLVCHTLDANLMTSVKKNNEKPAEGQGNDLLVPGGEIMAQR